MVERRQKERRRSMVEGGQKGRWYWMPATVLIVGFISIALLLLVQHISDRLNEEEMLVEAIMGVQIHAATAHLRLEEIVRGEPEVTIETALASLDQAIHLTGVLLYGGDAGNGNLIKEPLRKPEYRAETDLIRTILIRFRALGLERLQDLEGAVRDSAMYQQFHADFTEILVRSQQLESSIEMDEAEHQRESKCLFFAILIIWLCIVIAGTVALWTSERRRKRAGEELLKANEQLYMQTEELEVHRTRLNELVHEQTAELAEANERLRLEIVEHQQAETALRESEKQLHLLSSRIMTAQETERKRISRELHDELGHALTIMKLRLKAVSRVCPGNAGSKEECEDIMGYIDQTIDSVRRLSRDLSPSILEDLGLTAAIRWLVDNFNRNFDGTIAVDLEEGIDRLFSVEESIMIYRIIQEAITNIGKYADAREASVIGRKVEGATTFCIEDNGRGFNAPLFFGTDLVGKGSGLAIMEERVRMIGGSFEIESQEGKGTRITFRLPTRKE